MRVLEEGIFDSGQCIRYVMSGFNNVKATHATILRVGRWMPHWLRKDFGPAWYHKASATRVVGPSEERISHEHRRACAEGGRMSSDGPLVQRGASGGLASMKEPIRVPRVSSLLGSLTAPSRSEASVQTEVPLVYDEKAVHVESAHMVEAECRTSSLRPEHENWVKIAVSRIRCFPRVNAVSGLRPQAVQVEMAYTFKACVYSGVKNSVHPGLPPPEHPCCH